MTEYQQLNTDLWDLIRRTVTLAGPWEQLDTQHIRETFVNSDLRDGQGFYQWVSNHGDSNTLVKQMELQTQLAKFPNLDVSASCTVQRVITHLTQLLNLLLAWELPRMS